VAKAAVPDANQRHALETPTDRVFTFSASSVLTNVHDSPPKRAIVVAAEH
jgi:hypothetical protein